MSRTLAARLARHSANFGDHCDGRSLAIPAIRLAGRFGRQCIGYL